MGKVEPVAYGIRDSRGYYDFVDPRGKQRHYDDKGTNAVPLYTAEQIAEAVEELRDSAPAPTGSETIDEIRSYDFGWNAFADALLARFATEET